jgi:hypothetical protein
MEKLAPTIFSREANEFPEKPGYCFDGGFVEDPSEWRMEISTLYISMPVYPGLKIIIDFKSAGRPVEPDTDDHIDMAKSQMESAKIIRNRKVKFVEGFDNVREICLRDTKIINNQKEYHCVLAAEGDPKRLDRPNVFMRMTTGDFLTQGIPDGLAAFQYDSECLELWDALVERVRPRPTTPLK